MPELRPNLGGAHLGTASQENRPVVFIRHAVAAVGQGHWLDFGEKEGDLCSLPAHNDHHAAVTPLRPPQMVTIVTADDLTQAQYFAGLTNATPEKRLKFAEALANTNQYFLNTPDQSALILGSSHNMANNLLALASQKKGQSK